MSAKEMFEQLGYRLVKVENPITGEIYRHDIQYELHFKESNIFANRVYEMPMK